MVNLCTRYSELNRYIQKEDYEKVILCADNYLSTCYDGKVFHCKVVALLHLNRFEECVETLGGNRGGLHFEKAYSLYRLGRTEEALIAVDSSPEKDKLEYLELKAQICYAMGDYQTSYDLYKSILRQSTDRHDDERKTNLIASLANLHVSDLDTELVRLSRDNDVAESYESLFNIACGYMNARKFSEAEHYLRLAEKCCIEDTPQEDLENEMQVVKTQLACCRHFQARHDLAYDAYKSVLDGKPNDNNISAVIHNNVMVMNKNTNYFELKKNLRTLQNDLQVSKLTPLQKSVINSNIGLICVMNSENIDEALSNFDLRFCNDNSINRETVLLLKAACCIKYNDINKALEVLKTNSKPCQVPKLKLCLATTQIYLNTGNYVKACKTIRSLEEEDAFRPGIFSALVTIMVAIKDFNGVEQLLRETVNFYRLNKRSLAELWHYLSSIKVNSGLKGVVVQSLEELLKIRPNDYKVLSKLTIAYSKISPSKAFSLCDRIREYLAFEVLPDAGRLETSNWSLGITKTRARNLQQLGEAQDSLKRRRIRKKRKKRLPKDLDPLRPPDPERWLPRHERSAFKRRHDRRNRDLPKAHQLDMTKQAKDSKPSPSAIRTSSEDPKANLKYLHKRKKKTGRR